MSSHVADTHAVLWHFAGAKQKLGRKARRVLAATVTGKSVVVVPIIAIWEIALLHDEGRIRLPAGFTAWCDALEAAPGWRIESLIREDIDIARELRALTEPHDRLIAATARRMRLPLITRDEQITESRLVVTVWS